jgi:SAM-dependent methyltransferase
MQLSISIADVLPRIPMSAHTILDVGCGTGELAAAFRRINPKARLLGIEIDPLAAALAAPHLDQVSISDVEAGPLPFDIPNGIDCIIYNDVLQHLHDPWAVIRRHAEALSPDGVMLICVPNTEYWRLTEARLRGIRDEGETGWRHHAHGQWLNLAGIGEYLRLAGLTLCDVTIREPDSDSAKRFADTLTPALSALGIDARDYARRSAGSHLICRVRRDPVQQMIVSGSMLTPVGGVSHVRVVHPLQAVGTDPSVSSGVTDQVARQRPTDGIPRIFVLHRPALIGSQGEDLITKLTGAGYLTITEFDDHPDHFDMMRKGGDLTFAGVHAVQTSTAVLADVLRQYNPEVAVFPNAVVSLPDVRNFADPSCMTLFFGALNREQDWQPFMPVINSVAARAGERLRFQVVHDRTFFDALDTAHKTFTPTCDYDTYLRILGGSDISFMPLSDTPFNRAKSDLKFIEAASCRVAALASTIVYGDSIDDWRTGLLFRDPAEFRARLLRLIALPELSRQVGDAARAYVADQRMLAYQVAPRIEWYRSLWDRREVLEAARHDRLQRRMAG